MDRARRRAACLLLALLLVPGCAGLSPSLRGAGAPGRVVGRLATGPAAGPVLVYLELEEVALEEAAGPETTSTGSAERETEALAPTGAEADGREPAIAGTVEVTIRDGVQEPPLALLHPGQGLRLRNHDPIHHELFTVGSRNSLALRIPGGSRSASLRLPHRELVRAFCRLHPNESFAFLVSSAEHHAHLGEDGTFVIPDVAPGAYRLWAVSRSGRSGGTLVRVEAGGTTAQDVRLEARPE